MIEKTHGTQEGCIHYWTNAQTHEGCVWLIFLPGLTADHGLFAPQTGYFEDKLNCLVWDAPAHAASRPWSGDIDLELFARLLHDILQAEQVENFILVGQSLGGYISQTFMELFPREASGFISIDSAPLKRSYYQGWELWALKHTHLMYLSIPWKRLLAWGAKGCSTTETGYRYMVETMQCYSKRAYCRLAADGYRSLALAVEAPYDYDIDCRTLLVCGEEDAAGSTKRYNRAWHEREGFELLWIPGAGHNSTLDAPESVNRAIEDFAQGTPSTLAAHTL